MLDLYMLCVDLKNTQSNNRKKCNNIIHNMYIFLKNPSEKSACILEAWKEDFRYIYGDVNSNLSSNSKLKPENILNEYCIEYSKNEWQEDIQLLFFSIQTFFSILIKCLMKRILCPNNVDEDFKGLLLGLYTEQEGVINYCYEDWYCWPVYEMNNGFEQIMKDVLALVDGYYIEQDLDNFVRNNNYDYIKQMYEAIIPKELRHALGEYYTPDWLAEVTLKELCNQQEKDITEMSFMDPTCGSGTFIFKTILEKRKRGQGINEIVNSVYGFDINPLAVLTAKTNYLLSIIDLIDKNNPIEIPVYNVDVVRIGEESDNTIELNDDLQNPPEIIKHCIKNDRRIGAKLEKVDAIIGNPPWVNWEYMPEKYRANSQHMWIDYCLFSSKGRDLSFSKEDISVLITYVVMDKLLKDGGCLGFVIRQGVFKSAQNGVGFRRFRIKNECPVKVMRVDDLSKIRAFDNATNSTALFFAKKGIKNEYPVPYYLWEKRKDLKRSTFNAYSGMKEVLSQIIITEHQAMPTVEDDITSIWLTADKNNLKIMSRMLGSNQYKARTGVFTGGANAVYWLNILADNENNITIKNIVERAKRKVEQINMDIEKEFVYPMLKGSNVHKWNTTYDTYLLCTHSAETKMWPVSQKILKEKYPKTYKYLVNFKGDLNSRKGFAGWEKEIQKQEFHSILRVGEYTFSPYKVIWKYIASEFVCAVIDNVTDPYLGEKMLLPNEKIMYVSFQNELEAYYLCGVLSSTPISNCVKSYMNPTSISAHVLNKLNIPSFDLNNEDHLRIANICKEGHGKNNLSDYILQIDEIVEKMYSL